MPCLAHCRAHNVSAYAVDAFAVLTNWGDEAVGKGHVAQPRSVRKQVVRRGTISHDDESKEMKDNRVLKMIVTKKTDTSKYF